MIDEDPDIHAPMAVRWVEEEFGAHPEPGLDQGWSKLEKLQWHAGIVKAKTGIDVYITTNCYSHRNWLGRDVFEKNVFGIQIGNSTYVAYDYNECWDFIIGVEAGAEAMRGALPA